MVLVVKNALVNAVRDESLTPGSGRSLEEEMATHSNIRESHGQSGLVGYSPWSP